MNGTIVIVEGSDGAGKTSVIQGIVDSLVDLTVRVVGRKNESQLERISAIIEKEGAQMQPDANVNLRIALEFERWRLVERIRCQNDFVFLDRGCFSLEAWPYYLNVSSDRYSKQFEFLRDCYAGAQLLYCEASFTKCWSRIEERGDFSFKETLGRETNQRFYAHYSSIVSEALSDDRLGESLKIPVGIPAIP